MPIPHGRKKTAANFSAAVSKLSLGCCLLHVLADLRFATENNLEGGVGVDVALVLLVLKTVLLDVRPELLGELSAGERRGTYDRGERCIGSNRLHESGVWFTSGFFSHSATCHRTRRTQCNDFLEGKSLFSEEKCGVHAAGLILRSSIH